MRKKTTEEFKEEVNSKFVDKWILDRVDYKNTDTKVWIGCKVHGYWEIRPDAILSGQGCPKCKVEARSNTTEEFKQEVISKYGDKWNLDKIDYKNNKTKVLIGCKKHGYFDIKPNNLLSGQGCPKCKGNTLSKLYSKTSEEFKNEVISKYGDKWILDSVDYKNNRTKVLIGCKKHGYWEITPHNLLNGKGCPKCNSSKGEEKVAKWLDDHDISYISQHRFNDCRNKLPLPFDFYIPSKNTVIEFHGRQHYEPVGSFGGESQYLKNVQNDRKKSNYCWEHGITLIIIPYHYSDLQFECSLLPLLA